jgi:hypothetical protein
MATALPMAVTALTTSSRQAQSTWVSVPAPRMYWGSFRIGVRRRNAGMEEAKVSR